MYANSKSQAAKSGISCSSYHDLCQSVAILLRASYYDRPPFT